MFSNPAPKVEGILYVFKKNTNSFKTEKVNLLSINQKKLRAMEFQKKERFEL